MNTLDAINDQLEQHRKKHLEKIPDLTQEYMKKGREVLDESKWKDWDCIVPIRLHELYEGTELKAFLEIATALSNERTFEEIKDIINSQNHSGSSFSIVCLLIKDFCPNHTEYAERLINDLKNN